MRLLTLPRFRRSRLSIDLPGRHGEDTVRITIPTGKGRHRPVEDDSRQRSVWELRANANLKVWEAPGPQHLRDDREAAPEEVSA